MQDQEPSNRDIRWAHGEARRPLERWVDSPGENLIYDQAPRADALLGIGNSAAVGRDLG